MRILVCTQEYYPKGSGIANVAYYIVEALRKRGHKIKILSTDCGDINFKEYEKKINRFGGLALLGFWRKVRNFINKNHDNYDLIWVHNPLFLGKVNPEKIYSTVHTTYVEYARIYKTFPYPWYIKQYYKVMKFLEKRCYRKNKFKTNVISPALIKEMKSLGIKAKYIPNGVDTKKFKPVSQKYKLSIPKNAKVVLCVGRVTFQKCPFKLIDTFKKIKDVHLVWAGTGELFEKAKKLAKGHNNIHFLGKVPHEKLPSLFARASAYILASVYEGQPLTVLEALSSGTPCILSDIPNLTHIIKDSKTGIIVDFDKKDSADKIVKYLKKDLKKESERSRAYAVKHLDWSVIAKQYEKEWMK